VAARGLDGSHGGETGEHLSITAILVKVIAETLKQHPRANASFETIDQTAQAINVGVASGNEAGLVVPVIKAADQNRWSRSSVKSRHFKTKRSRCVSARMTWRMAPLRFRIWECTASSSSTPFSIHRKRDSGRRQSDQNPIGLPDDTIALRPLMSLTLTVDHRVMDGARGAVSG
jgi:pyruvate dehydrogenase E2 component (dihydrolipoamide acetyltransferase)